MNKKYPDIANELEQLIKNGKISSGGRLPPEKELARRLKVSHLTLRKALAILEKKKIIHKIASRGSFIGQNRSLRKPSNMIGLLIPEKDPFFFDVIIALEKHLALFNYGLLLQVSQDDPAREGEALKYFVERDVDGIMAVPGWKSIDSYRQLEKPVVFFDNMIEDLNIPYVLNDDFQAACNAVEYLFKAGHRRIAYIGGHNNHSASQRRQGYLSILKKHGLPRRDEYIYMREYSREWGYSAGAKLLALNEPPSAVFCGNDSIALGFLRYLKAAGIECPGQISLIGCCNAPFSEDIGLSTIDQNIDAMVKALWKTMLSLFDGTRAAPLTLMPSRLVIRDSIANIR